MTANAIGFSIEISAKHALQGTLAAELFPRDTSVYITDVGADPLDDIVSAALETRLRRLHDEAAVKDILVIAGEADRQMGPYGDTLSVLRTGLIDEIGFSDMGIGGHPEGNPAYGESDVMEILRQKHEFSRQSSARMRIVTQFGFDGSLFANWARSVRESGIDLPIHLGIAGPAKITTLLKYAAMCGVGNSMNFFRKRTSAVAQLATRHSPEDIAAPIESAWRQEDSPIDRLHIFPFGGLQATRDWLIERGSMNP